jgi:hypothetical protein
MKNDEYHRIGELATQLGKAGIRQVTIDKIMEGGENISRKTSPAKKGRLEKAIEPSLKRMAWPVTILSPGS